MKSATAIGPMAFAVVRICATSSSGMPAEHRLHVGQGVDGHSDPPDFSLGERVIGVEPVLGGQVKGNRESALALGEERPDTQVGLGRARNPRILAHDPEAFPVHPGQHAPRKRRLPGKPELAQVGIRVAATSRGV